MPENDDYKIDFTDIVSILFGEQIEKVDADKAKKILNGEEKESIHKHTDDTAKKELSVDEEELLKQFEVERELIKKEEETKGGFAGYLVIDREKLAEALSGSKKENSVVEQKTDQQNPDKREVQNMQDSINFTMTYGERIALIQLFDRAQKILAELLGKLIKKKPVNTMFLKTLEQAIEKHNEVLKKVDYNQNGKLKNDGIIEAGRLIANINALQGGEDIKTKKVIEALEDIFEERLIAIEIALGSQVKNEIMSKLFRQFGKITENVLFTQKVKSIFMDFVVPSTAIKPGE